MRKCNSTFEVPAVRGQKDTKGKPIMVTLHCNVSTPGHAVHANEVVDGKPIRFSWQ